MINLFQILNVMVVFFFCFPLVKFYQRSVLEYVKCVVEWFPTCAFLTINSANHKANSHVGTNIFESKILTLYKRSE